MATGRGLGIVTDGLVFYYDTGNSIDSYKGEPTTNLLGETGNMLPTDPSTPYDLTTSSNNVSNVNGTTWDLNRWPNTNLAADGGIAWDPYIKGPGFTGAWRLKKRPGGNSETQFQNELGAVSNDTGITISVWCKSSVANAARIHINTTKAGSSYWGYGSAYHSGNGTWEKLNLTIPGGSEVTSINTIRCQVVGTTINTDVYFRHFQVEYNSHPTQFTTGTRSATQGLLDISGQGTSIDISNASFDSNAQMTFDGTDDKLHGIQTVHSYLSSSAIEFIVSPETSNKRMMVGGYRHNQGYSSPTIGSVYIDSDNKFKASVITTTEGYRFVASSTTINANQTYHVIFNKNTSDGNMELYVNGILQSSQTFDSTTYAQWASAGSYIGSDNIDLGKSFNTNSGQGWSGDYFEGKIHIFKIHSRILTASEVKRNYNALKTRFGLI